MFSPQKGKTALTRSETVTAPDAGKTQFAAVVNRASGYVGEKSPAHVQAMLENAAHSRLCDLKFLDPDDILEGLKDAFEGPCGGVIVLGGDGTARCAAEFAMKHDKPLIPLPGGTMNLLPRKLYGERGPADALRAALDGQRALIDAGQADDRLFFLSAAFGFAPDMTRAREAFRGQTGLDALPRVLSFARRALADAFHMNVLFGVDGEEPGREAELLVVALGGLSHLMELKVDEDVGRKFECIASDVHDLGEAARLGFNALTQRWREDPGVAIDCTEQVRVKLKEEDPYGVLDGEPMKLKCEFDVRYLKDAIPVLAPAKA